MVYSWVRELWFREEAESCERGDAARGMLRSIARERVKWGSECISLYFDVSSVVASAFFKIF